MSEFNPKKYIKAINFRVLLIMILVSICIYMNYHYDEKNRISNVKFKEDLLLKVDSLNDIIFHKVDSITTKSNKKLLDNQNIISNKIQKIDNNLRNK